LDLPLEGKIKIVTRSVEVGRHGLQEVEETGKLQSYFGFTKNLTAANNLNWVVVPFKILRIKFISLSN
jgi:hypothetical protein